MTETITCARCGEVKPPLPKRVYPGSLGDAIQRSICSDCWQEWQHMEVMVINELRLNFMDPKAQDILVEQMREFLCLTETD